MMGNAFARQRMAPLAPPAARRKVEGGGHGGNPGGGGGGGGAAQQQRWRPPYRALEGCSPVGDGSKARALLRRDGCVVFKGAASAAELAVGEALFWDWLEGTAAGAKAGLRRDRPHTHTNEVWKSLGYSNTGVMAGESVGQSAFLWHVRSLPGVRSAFEAVWGLDDRGGGQKKKKTQDDAAATGNGLENNDNSSHCSSSSSSKSGGGTSSSSGDGCNRQRQLATSFDGCGVWRNYWLHGGAGSGTATDGNWFHLDQSSHEAPGFETVQGLLNFYPTTAETGSTVMVVGSHKDFERNCRGKPLRGSFVRMHTSAADLAYCRERAVCVALEAGDLIVWDSRTVHCSSGVDTSVTTSIPPQRLPPPAPPPPPPPSSSSSSSFSSSASGGKLSSSSSSSSSNEFTSASEEQRRQEQEQRKRGQQHPLARLVAYVAMLPRARLGRSDGERRKVEEARRRAVERGTSSGHDPRRMRTRSQPAAHYKAPARSSRIWDLV